MNIQIKNDLTLWPFSLYVAATESQFQLSPDTRAGFLESEEYDGEYYSHTNLANGDMLLRCYSPDVITEQALIALKSTIAQSIVALKEQSYLTLESNPERRKPCRLVGKVDYVEKANYFIVGIPLKVAPYWEAVTEKSLTASGQAANAGNVNSPFIVEITGAINNPEVVINGETLKYNGLLGALDTVVIDTDKQTVVLNGVISVRKNFEGTYPSLNPGNNAVTLPANTLLRWRDQWL